MLDPGAHAPALPAGLIVMTSPLSCWITWTLLDALPPLTPLPPEYLAATVKVPSELGTHVTAAAPLATLAVFRYLPLMEKSTDPLALVGVILAVS